MFFRKKINNSDNNINGYRLLQPFTASGMARWSFAEKDGKCYFIKEHLSPVLKTESDGFSTAMVQRSEKACKNYFEKKSKLYETIKAADTGNIVYIRDFFCFGSKFYSITDRVDGNKLENLKPQKLKEKERIIVLCSLASSVSALHAYGIIHADLKPSNILLKKTAKAYALKLIDFDASFFEGKPPRELQMDQVYVAPETFLALYGEKVDITRAADIFSLGLIFHYFYTGKLPICPENMYPHGAVLEGYPLECDSEIPQPIKELINNMLQLEPKNRPNAYAVLKALQNYAHTVL